jgi:ATP-dependent Clp endopeptidase proteolytic subunit ClpP
MEVKMKLNFKSKDKAGTIKECGHLEIKNKTEESADLYFYGDIVSAEWMKWDDTDKAPQDVSDFLKNLDGMKKINMYINSGGGDVFAGLAIYNMLKRNSAEKTVYVDGMAASIASVIMMAGDKIVVPTTAQVMIHNPWTIAIGNANDFRKLADDLDTINESILAVYGENLKDGVEINTIKELMDNETWMPGNKAAEYFNIETVEKQVAACASDYFEKYNNVPDGLINNQPDPKPQDNTEKEALLLKIDLI